MSTAERPDVEIVSGALEDQMRLLVEFLRQRHLDLLGHLPHRQPLLEEETPT